MGTRSSFAWIEKHTGFESPAAGASGDSPPPAGDR